MPTTLFIVIDGLRPDAIALTETPNMDAMMARGAYSLNCTSVMPSVTLPCHISMFHSVPPSRHGITSNTYMPMARPLPGLVEQASTAGKHCAFVYNWEQLRDCSRPGYLEYSYFDKTNREFEHGDEDIALIAADYIRNQHPDFIFVYLGALDEYAHDMGWMTDAYLAQVSVADQAVGVLLDSLDEKDFVLLQADHGGHERGHGTESDDDMLIPWIIAGPGIRAGFEIPVPVSLLDTAPTLAHILDVPASPAWEGRVVSEIFA